jgi:thiol-disulfide isomerase/thioredoxin
MKTNIKYIIYTLLLLIFSISQPALSQTAARAGNATPQEIQKLRAAVEAAPDSLKTHQAYIKAAGINSPEVAAQYEQWIKMFTKSAMVPFAIGDAFANMESPKAKPYLLKAVAINPKFAEAWGGLWEDAQRWGDFKGGDEYLEKATESDPANAQYAFYYANSFRDKDEKKYKEMTLDVARRFPDNERGAQALYWLAYDSKDISDKIKIYGLLKSSFLPAKFDWSSGGMSGLYAILLDTDPGKAVSLAQEMTTIKGEETKSWENNVIIAQQIMQAKNLLDQKKGDQALSLLDQVKLPRYFEYEGLPILKAEANDMAGNTSAAYDSLIAVFAKKPTVKLKAAIVGFGNKVGKDKAKVDADIWKRIDMVAQFATPFTLKNYLTPGSTSLSDYKGKVVLLTYWFPGCGPCRGEFPHFENVVKKYKSQDLAFVGIDIVPEQNEYVVPFMRSSGYSFTPLEDFKGRKRGNLDNHNQAPFNYLIDNQGRIVFIDFRIDGNNEDDLEMMINMLLEHKA